MAGLVAMLILALSLAVLFWFLADRIEAGKMQPNMGHHNQDNTTPESWRAMSFAVAHAMRDGARWYLGSGVLGIAVAAWTGSAGDGIAAAGAGMGIACAPLVLGLIRAGQMLVPRPT